MTANDEGDPLPVPADHAEARPVPNPAAGVTALARRLGATARNVAEVVRYGGLETDEQASPFEVVTSQQHYKLRHYFADSASTGDASTGDAPAVLLVPPLMLTTEVWDVSPRASAVASLHALGVDPWVVDFGHPDEEPGGLERTLTDHVLAVSDAVDRVAAATGRPVVLAGYSQGGMFAYQAAALRRGRDIDSLVTFGSPVDTTAPLPIPLAPDVAARLASTLVESGLFRRIAVPGWFSRLGFKLLTPAKSVQGRVQFLLALHDRDALLPRERQRRFLESEGWTAWSGPAVAELLEQFYAHNRMLEGGFVISDRLVTLADIDVPIMTVVGTTDTFGHPDSVRAIRRAAPKADVYELTLRAGHFGLVVGSTASERTWPAVAAWVSWRAGAAELPADIVEAENVTIGAGQASTGAAGAIAQATELGMGATRIMVNTAQRAAGLVRGLVSEAPTQLSRLSRLEQLEPTTRISLGLLLDEQAARAPEDVLLLFGDRAVRQVEFKNRVDAVVRGLASVGVRPGDRVGVLMTTRPSAFSVVAALSRLGAIAVLLRPDGDLAREATLGRVSWVVSDPDHIPADRSVLETSPLSQATWCVLGGGSAVRELPGVVDLERIDPDKVTLPAWYRANPHRAGDVAFVVFTGDGTGTRAVSLTNRRWAMSALGTATAAALRPGDTVYSVTPIHHSSALLMSLGGAVAGGARFALAAAEDADTFWDEVRRYGATHVTYTWSSLRDIVDGPPHPSEAHHPIRMFLGSGLPRALWKRTSARFPDTRILEFYASATGEAILANLRGDKAGSMGRPLPGTPEVRVVAVDLLTGALQRTTDGFARECLADEIGLLIARADTDTPLDPAGETPMRAVFTGDDAWRSTGDLFMRDQQGDLWLAGPVAETLRTARGPVLPAGARFCLGTLPGVDLYVAYGVPDPDGGGSLLVGAFTMLPGRAVSDADLDAAMDRLPGRAKPRFVQQVPELPLTTWHRPLWRPLQAAGVPEPGEDRVVWELVDGHYRRR